jgi:hypothetical protein
MGQANWNPITWDFHEVCWTAFATNSTVYDAALHLTQAAAVLPANLPFESAQPQATDYRPCLTNTNLQTSGNAERYPVV